MCRRRLRIGDLRIIDDYRFVEIIDTNTGETYFNGRCVPKDLYHLKVRYYWVFNGELLVVEVC